MMIRKKLKLIFILMIFTFPLYFCGGARKNVEKPISEKEEVISEEKTKPLKALEIALPDTKGKIRKLSDQRGKVVLIDFWASWCAPCRKENPKVVKLYKKYKDKNFEVFSVSLDGLKSQENPKDDWLEAISKDELIWQNHVSELHAWDSEVVEEYAIESIPRMVLIDQKGNIVFGDPTLEEVEYYLEEYL